MASVLQKSLMDIESRELKRIIKDIPTLPVIYQELFQKMQDPNVSVPQIAEIISMDQSLSTKVLHLVNSAFYGYNKQIKTISRAVVILGFQAVRSAALAISVFDFFEEDGGEGAIDMTKFWEHSIAVASISKVLAPVLSVHPPEEAFVVGLLHDAGKLIEKRYFPADFQEVCTAAQENHLTWYETEKALFQLHHASIGKTIFRSWDFPASVVEAVQCHHNPRSSTKFTHLTSLVHLADFLSYQLGYGAPGAWPPTACHPDVLKTLNFTPEQAEEYQPQIEEEIGQAMGILNLLG